MDVIATDGGSNYTRYMFDQFGSAMAPGTWISNPDAHLKYDVARMDNPLEKMQAIRGDFTE